MTAKHILLVDDEVRLREMLGILLRRSGYQVTSASGVQDALAQLRAGTFDAVLSDLKMPDGSGLEVLQAVQDLRPSTQVVLMTAYGTTGVAVEAMRNGAYDFLEKPFKNEVLLATLDKAIEKHSIVEENRALRAQINGSSIDLIGVSQPMRHLRETIGRAAAAPTSVLITGESGTGKELVARALHEHSPRSKAPFVVINCGALPENLMESELFGHEKGAFTGATANKDGLLRAATGGTLFLDEIGEMPLALQVKLLRVLQERKVRPLGGSKELPIDVRIVAATNRDLEEEVRRGMFREDLFYRLNVIRLCLPPLRQRPEDIPGLAQHLLQKHSLLQQRNLRLGKAALAWLGKQAFPGNVRELENLIERAVALAPGHTIEPTDLGSPSPAPTAGRIEDIDFEAGFDLEAYLGGIEHRILQAALDEAAGNRTKASRLLGLSFRSFRYRLAKYETGESN